MGPRDLAQTLTRILACCAFMLCSGRAAAQSQGGSIVGYVTDTTGASVSGAVGEIRAGGSGLSFTTGTDGQFRLSALQPGEYTLTVWKSGFYPAERTGLPVRAGETLSLVLRLEVKA